VRVETEAMMGTLQTLANGGGGRLQICHYKTPSSGLFFNPSSQATITTTFQRLDLSPSSGEIKKFGSKTPGIKPSEHNYCGEETKSNYFTNINNKWIKYTYTIQKHYNK
jgi:hypothetical protein